MRPVATDGVAGSVNVSVCLSDMSVIPAKAAEPIVMLFRKLTAVGQKNHVLDVVLKGHFEGEKWRPCVELCNAYIQEFE